MWRRIAALLSGLLVARKIDPSRHLASRVSPPLHIGGRISEVATKCREIAAGLLELSQDVLTIIEHDACIALAAQYSTLHARSRITPCREDSPSHCRRRVGRQST
jgi:hypothetical protein